MRACRLVEVGRPPDPTLHQMPMATQQVYLWVKRMSCRPRILNMGVSFSVCPLKSRGLLTSTGNAANQFCTCFSPAAGGRRSRRISPRIRINAVRLALLTHNWESPISVLGIAAVYTNTPFIMILLIIGLYVSYWFDYANAGYFGSGLHPVWMTPA
jgi:hypothetical protein